MQATKFRLLKAVALALVGALLNFAVFVFFYNRLATPFLLEEQRVANAGTIVAVVLPAFVVAAAAVAAVAWLVLGTRTSPPKH
ncbi:MAG: hypothetical protein KDG52_09655 [Rhodocyclaceae bacterium]|nr:hypothetical protein [Rhodocyclaceae bacterium]